MGSTPAMLQRDEQIAVNINFRAQVTLTPRGREVLDEFYVTTYPELYGNINKRRDTIRVCHENDDGSMRFSLFQLMAIFGPSLPDIATSSPKYHLFEGNNITIVAD